MYLKDLDVSLNVEDYRVIQSTTLEAKSDILSIVAQNAPYAGNHPVAASLVILGVLAICAFLVYVAFVAGE